LEAPDRGECGFKRIDTFEVADLACQIAAVVPRGPGANGAFDPDEWFDPKEQRKVDDFIIYGVCRRPRLWPTPAGKRTRSRSRKRRAFSSDPELAVSAAFMKPR